MANLIELAEQMKGMPDPWLQQQAQQPDGSVPPYLVLAEISRRQALRKQMTQAPATTVYDDLLRPPGPPGMPGGAIPPGITNPLATIGRMNAPPQGGLPATLGPGGQPPGMPGLSQGIGALAQRMPPPGMQQRPPMGMAKGGVVRLYQGGGDFFDDGNAGLDDETDEEYFQRKREEELAALEASRPKLTLPQIAGVRPQRHFAPPTGPFPPQEKPTPGSGFVRGIEFMGYPTLQIPDFTPQEPIRVNEPELGPLLKQVRELRQTVTPVTKPLEDRIRELETEYKSIRGPRWQDAMVETGLGVMASNSFMPLQALGQAGLGALRTYRGREREADYRRTSIGERLASYRAAEAQAAQNAVDKDISLAGDIQQRLHGKAVTEAQGIMSQQSAERAARLAAVEAYNRQLTGGWQAANTLSMAKLNALPKIKEPYEPLTEQEKIDWQERQDYLHGHRMAEIEAREDAQEEKKKGPREWYHEQTPQGAFDTFAMDAIKGQIHQMRKGDPKQAYWLSMIDPNRPIPPKRADGKIEVLPDESTFWAEMQKRAKDNVDKFYQGKFTPGAADRAKRAIGDTKMPEDFDPWGMLQPPIPGTGTPGTEKTEGTEPTVKLKRKTIDTDMGTMMQGDPTPKREFNFDSKGNRIKKPEPTPGPQGSFRMPGSIGEGITRREPGEPRFADEARIAQTMAYYEIPRDAAIRKLRGEGWIVFDSVLPNGAYDAAAVAGRYGG